ncbi:cob(I)yrinic acid a,c-diamide adenosyltransferase [Candidatus Micrarchaeota archaeon]|nr:cob(I)yrinic acid a,c-diamide adenosyltransferase [Candidatus Micrarchaeota archaeon]
MPIYTKFGDKGNTSLLGGIVVPKDDPRVEAYGSVDELNATLGIVIAFNDIEIVSKSLTQIQNDLFVIGAELAAKEVSSNELYARRSDEMEKEIDSLYSQLPVLKNFVLPGGSKTASLLHLARTVCRRAERAIVSLSQEEKVNPDIIIYINRLGDLIFTQARFVNFKKGSKEVIWKGS